MKYLIDFANFGLRELLAQGKLVLKKVKISRNGKIGYGNRYFKKPLDNLYNYKNLSQHYNGAATSRNQIPAGSKVINWKPGTTNLDIGGGANWNNTHPHTDYLKEKGVTNLVYDPFNQSKLHNANIIRKIARNKTDTATIHNVLNVIEDPKIRKQVLNQAKKGVIKNGEIYITVHPGSPSKTSGIKAGSGTPYYDNKKKTMQNNRPIQTYLDEIRSVFPNVKKQKNIIIAKND